MKKNINKIAIIGGSGLYKIEDAEIISKKSLSTPFGMPSSDIVEIQFGEASCFFLARHGESHSLLPQEVNYCANIYALKQLGVDCIISISAVGSLVDDLPPGSFFLPDQYINMAKGIRRSTFFGEGIVGHVSVANPVHIGVNEIILESLSDLEVKSGGSYICIEGPQLSSKAESIYYKNLDGAVIGMTNATEAYLAREAGMAFSSLCMVTDFDSWKGIETGIDQIIKTMNENVSVVKKNLSKLINSLKKAEIIYETKNDYCVLTPKEFLSEEQALIVDTLLS